MAQVYSYTSTGKKVAYSPRSGVPKSSLGTLVNGTVWRHPRQGEQIRSGGSVVVTNQAASTARGRNTRTGSLGMGGVLQRGRNRDY